MLQQLHAPNLTGSGLEEVGTYYASLIRSVLREPVGSPCRRELLDNLHIHLDANSSEHQLSIVLAASAFLHQGECLLLAHEFLINSVNTKKGDRRDE